MAHLFVAWAFVVTILVQVFIAGLVAFAQESWSLHQTFGGPPRHPAIKFIRDVRV